jgi:hypothetical protein
LALLGFLAICGAEPLQAQIRDTVPEPRSVMLKSVMLPGWGQVVNGHTWKVPVVYSGLAAVVAYSVWSGTRYNGYRAAYYNSFPDQTDRRFGATPGWIDSNQPASIFKANRDLYRNRRDMSYLYFGLVWGFNALDAYIFAHLRDFDVSDDLSITLLLTPDPVMPHHPPVITLRIPIPSKR